MPYTVYAYDSRRQADVDAYTEVFRDLSTKEMQAEVTRLHRCHYWVHVYRGGEFQYKCYPKGEEQE
jgi:hypothetical protein